MKKKKKTSFTVSFSRREKSLNWENKKQKQKKNCSLIINIPTAMQADLELNKKLTTDRKAVVFLLRFT